MLFTFGQYTVDVDAEKTNQFYVNEQTASAQCSCDGCLNFEKAVPGLPKEVQVFFADLGIDIAKPAECYVNHKNADGTLSYSGFYHLCGTLISGESAWEKIDRNSSFWNSKAAFSVVPNFEAAFQKDIDLLNPSFPLPAIQLEFTAKIPWVLNRKNK